MSFRAPSLREQLIMLPELLAERVEGGPHAARFFLHLAMTLDLQLYKRFYLGAPPYNRATLVAVVLYAMSKGHFENRGIVQFVEDSIGAQWILNGMEMPSYKTVERTINGIIKELDYIFQQILALCGEQGLIGVTRRNDTSRNDAQKTCKNTGERHEKIQATRKTLRNDNLAGKKKTSERNITHSLHFAHY